MRGIVNNEEARLRLNIINDKLLLALDSFSNEGIPLPGKVSSKKERSKKLLLKIGLILLSIGLFFGAIAWWFNSSDSNDMSSIFGLSSFLISVIGLFFIAIWAAAVFMNAVRDN